MDQPPIDLSAEPDNRMFTELERSPGLVGVQKLKVWHEMVAEYMLLNPTATQIEIAAHFDVTPVGLSYVTNSDMFKMFFRKRKKNMEDTVDQSAMERLRGKLGGLAERTLDVLDEKIQAERANLGIEAVRETADMALKALGFSAPRSNGPQTPAINLQVNVGADTLREARELMAERQQPALPSK